MPRSSSLFKLSRDLPRVKTLSSGVLPRGVCSSRRAALVDLAFTSLFHATSLACAFALPPDRLREYMLKTPSFLFVFEDPRATSLL